MRGSLRTSLHTHAVRGTAKISMDMRKAPGPLGSRGLPAEDGGFEPPRAVNPTRVPGVRHRPLGESSLVRPQAADRARAGSIITRSSWAAPILRGRRELGPGLPAARIAAPAATLLDSSTAPHVVSSR